jgi:hypothetical protein
MICLTALLFTAMLPPPAAYAHPPKNIDLAYDAGQQVLKVTILHNSHFPKYHYIKKLTITQNGKPLGEFTYKEQPDKLQFTYSYPLKAVSGDVIEVRATCNLYGSKSAQLTIP